MKTANTRSVWSAYEINTHTGQNYFTYNFDCDSLRSLHLHSFIYLLSLFRFIFNLLFLKVKLTLAFCIHYAFIEKGRHLDYKPISVQKQPKHGFLTPCMKHSLCIFDMTPKPNCKLKCTLMLLLTDRKCSHNCVFFYSLVIPKVEYRLLLLPDWVIVILIS